MEKLFSFKNASNMQISIFYVFSQPEMEIDFIKKNILNVILRSTILKGQYIRIKTETIEN